MRVLKLESKGPDVKRWQTFLIGQDLQPGAADGVFGKKTEQATSAFQAREGLTPVDGIVGNKTLGKAMTLGFVVVSDPDPSSAGPNFPPKPNFEPLTGLAARQALFGKFEFKSEPEPDNPENIRILGDWEDRNIVRVAVPQLVGIKGANAAGTMRFHSKAQGQLLALWKAWDDAGLLDRVLTFDGAFVARFIRGSRTVLSNHCFGTAFDINCDLNRLGAEPALMGEKGCVRELVALANQNGFYWGGHFTRRDGMHFEIAKLL